jgi:hypothetical protein
LNIQGDLKGKVKGKWSEEEVMIKLSQLVDESERIATES